MKKLLAVLLVLTLITGCKQAKETVETTSDAVEIENTSESYYKMIKTDKTSQLRDDYYSKFSRTDDLMTIGRGLQLLSDKYFSMDSYYMSEGTCLSLSNRKEMTSYYLSDDHPYSLELKKTEKIQGYSELDMVEDIHEQDYYAKNGNKYTLKGVSFAIVLDPKDTSTQEALNSAITDKNLKAYAKKCVEKFYSNIQEMSGFEDIRDLPILVAVYKRTDSSKSQLDGNYFLESYCNKSVGSFKDVNYKNILFTSSDAKEIDPTTYDEFTTIKNNLKSAAIESAGLVGKAKYIDDKIQSMTIEANLNIKTYTEILYLTSVIENNISSRFSTSFTINVLVYSQDKLQAIIVKNIGEDPQTTFLN
jgi:protein involved in sex pheromone biosynthesis